MNRRRGLKRERACVAVERLLVAAQISQHIASIAPRLNEVGLEGERGVATRERGLKVAEAHQCIAYVEMHVWLLRIDRDRLAHKLQCARRVAALQSHEPKQMQRREVARVLLEDSYAQTADLIEPALPKTRQGALKPLRVRAVHSTSAIACPTAKRSLHIPAITSMAVAFVYCKTRGVAAPPTISLVQSVGCPQPARADTIS